MPKDEINQTISASRACGDSLRSRLAHALDVCEGDPVRLATLRLVQCAIRDRDVAAHASDRCGGCEDTEIAELIGRMVSQREKSASVYEASGRAELAEREREEIAVLREFLPRPLSCDEIDNATRAVVEDLGATGLKDIGRCMAALRAAYADTMDFVKAGASLKRLLT